MKQKYTLLVVVSFLFVCLSMAQQSYVPTNDNLKNRKEFQDMKFGVFIHWGIYSMMADGEWIMNNKNINQRYNNPFLNPFNWAELINSIKRGDYSREKLKY